MTRPPTPDSRAQVDAIVHEHQLQYSLVQLRMVGILLLLLLASRLVGTLFSLGGTPIQQLSALTGLSNWLPLLPLAISLYLLGGGRQRQPREFLPTELLHRSLFPLALACLLLLPALTLRDVVQLGAQRDAAVAREQRMVNLHGQWLQQADAAATSIQVRQVAERNDVPVPILDGEPAELSRWRLARALELQQETLRRAEPMLTLSPWERELLSLPRTGTTILLQTLTGLGLLLLHRQGRREIHRHGVSTTLFFRADPVRRRRLIY